MKILKVIFVALVLLFVAGLFLLPRQKEEGQKGLSSQPLIRLVNWLFSPVLEAVAHTRQKMGGIQEDLKTLETLSREHAVLKEENSRLSAENQQLREMVRENDRLREVLGFVKNAPFELVAARIIARDPSNWWQGLLIDKGFGDNSRIDMNMPVITQDGLVGKITGVFKNQSRMVLLIDPNFKVSGVLTDSGEQGIVMGAVDATEVNPVLGMTYLSKKANIEVGQTVSTSGLGGVFPPGLKIGTVSDLKPPRDAGKTTLYREITLKPSVDFTRLEYVFIVVRKK